MHDPEDGPGMENGQSSSAAPGEPEFLVPPPPADRWPPAWFGAIRSADPDTAERTEEILAGRLPRLRGAMVRCSADFNELSEDGTLCVLQRNADQPLHSGTWVLLVDEEGSSIEGRVTASGRGLATIRTDADTWLPPPSVPAWRWLRALYHAAERSPLVYVATAPLWMVRYHWLARRRPS